MYGFPQRPSDSRYVADWVNSISWAKHRDCNGATQTLKGIVHKKNKSPVINDANINWDGYEVDYTPSTFWMNAARGWYNLNCVSGNGIGYSAWVGIGGSLGTYLWQAGWDGVYRKFWYEQVGGSKDTHGEVTLSLSPGPRCGDQAYTYVDYFKSNPNGTYTYLGDTTLGVYKSVSLNGGQSDEESAEWIDERPSCGNNPNGSPKVYNLGAFDQNNWQGDYWFLGDSGYHPITYDYNYQQDTIVDRNGYQLATTSAIDSSGERFTDTFLYSGSDGQC